jgi:predicted transcriptional regulator
VFRSQHLCAVSAHCLAARAPRRNSRHKWSLGGQGFNRARARFFRSGPAHPPKRASGPGPRGARCFAGRMANPFNRIGCGPYTFRMEVNLSPELQAKLDRIAAQLGRQSESLVHEAVERLVGYDEWFLREIEKGLAQMERGEVLEHEEVASRMEKRIAQRQRRL